MCAPHRHWQGRPDRVAPMQHLRAQAAGTRTARTGRRHAHGAHGPPVRARRARAAGTRCYVFITKSLPASPRCVQLCKLGAPPKAQPG